MKRKRSYLSREKRLVVIHDAIIEMSESELACGRSVRFSAAEISRFVGMANSGYFRRLLDDLTDARDLAMIGISHIGCVSIRYEYILPEYIDGVGWWEGRLF